MATAHARQIFEADGVRYLIGKWKLNPELLQEAATLLDNGQQLPYALGVYAGYALQIQLHKLNKTKARLKETNYWRNLFIAKAVREMDQFGFKPTRSTDKKPGKKQRACGCSIVAEVLTDLGLKNERGKKWKEGAVSKVWQSVLEKQNQDRLRLASAKHLLSSNQKVTARGLFAPPPGVGK